MTLAYEPPGEADAGPFYEALLTALSETSRGRAFLAEYTRRNRAADTEMLLAALSRLEAHIAREGETAERVRDELRMLLIAIRLARPEIEAADAPDKAAKLGRLLDMLDTRLAAIAGETSAAAAQAVPASEAEHAAAPAAAAPAPAPRHAVPLPEPSTSPSTAAPPDDPLAPLLALSEEERLALFT